MKIEFELGDDAPSSEKLELLCKNLGIDTSSMSDHMNRIAKASFFEYFNMITDHGVPDKAAEVRQERLEYLIRYYYKDHLPKESEIQLTFQLSSTESKTLLKNTRSKKRTGLEEQITNTVKAVLSGATKIGNKYRIIIKSTNVLQEMNEVISESGPGLYKVMPVRGMASVYECPDDTMDLLKREYGISDEV